MTRPYGPFHATGPHDCPSCPEDPAGQPLEHVRHAYAGGDLARCRRCGKFFVVSYQVAAVEELKGDQPARVFGQFPGRNP